MEEMDYNNKHIPEEVAPYAKAIYQHLKDVEVIFRTIFLINQGKIYPIQRIYVKTI